MVAFPTTVYQQCERFDPPVRFVETVKAYVLYLQQTDTTWSIRRLMEECELSHSYLTTIEERIKRTGGETKPMPSTIERIVAAINSHVPSFPGDQRWPIVAAMEAAGQLERYQSRPRTLPISKRQAAAERMRNDILPHTVSKIPAPIIDLADIAERGLGEAVSMRSVLNLSNNMALIRDNVPGYPLQRVGDWVLIQGADAKAGEMAWALVREGDDVKAVPRQAVTKEQRIIAWILGTMRLEV